MGKSAKKRPAGAAPARDHVPPDTVAVQPPQPAPGGKKADQPKAAKKDGAGKDTAKKQSIKKPGTKKIGAKKLAAKKPAATAAPAAMLPAPLLAVGTSPGVLDRLWTVISDRRGADPAVSHSARLLARGTAKVAQKLGEEAVECVIEAATGNRGATVLESADLLYHLLVVWVDAGIHPQEVWAELARRQGISGIAEKAARPQGIIRAAGTTKLP